MAIKGRHVEKLKAEIKLLHDLVPSSNQPNEKISTNVMQHMFVSFVFLRKSLLKAGKFLSIIFMLYKMTKTSTSRRTNSLKSINVRDHYEQLSCKDHNKVTSATFESS